MVDMLRSNGFAVYHSIHSTVKAVRRRGQSKFMLDALATGLLLMLTELKKKKDVAVEDETLLAYSEGVQTSPQSRSIITPTSLLAGSRMRTGQICAGSCAGCLPEMHNARC